MHERRLRVVRVYPGMTIIKKKDLSGLLNRFPKQKNMNEPGGYEWLRGEGAHEVLLVDECSNAAPQHSLEQHMRIKTVTTDNHLTFFKTAHAHRHTVMLIPWL